MRAGLHSVSDLLTQLICACGCCQQPGAGKDGENLTLTSNRTWHGSLATQTSQTPSTPQPDSHILHRIPPGAEATNVLVGSVDFLSAPVMAFVRLQEACALANLTEVPLPVRFIFILLGPTGSSSLDYHEIGRSISTLMADEVCLHLCACTVQGLQTLVECRIRFWIGTVLVTVGGFPM